MSDDIRASSLGEPVSQEATTYRVVLACNHCGHMPSIDVRLGELCTACGIGGFTVSKRASLSSSGSPASPLSEDTRRLDWLESLGQCAIREGVDGLEVAVCKHLVPLGIGGNLRAAIDRASSLNPLSSSAPSPEDKGSDKSLSGEEREAIADIRQAVIDVYGIASSSAKGMLATLDRLAPSPGDKGSANG